MASSSHTTLPPFIIYWSMMNLSDSLKGFVGFATIIALYPDIIEASSASTPLSIWKYRLSCSDIEYVSSSDSSPCPSIKAILSKLLLFRIFMASIRLYSSSSIAAFTLSSPLFIPVCFILHTGRVSLSSITSAQGKISVCDTLPPASRVEIVIGDSPRSSRR